MKDYESVVVNDIDDVILMLMMIMLITGINHSYKTKHSLCHHIIIILLQIWHENLYATASIPNG